MRWILGMLTKFGSAEIEILSVIFLIEGFEGAQHNHRAGVNMTVIKKAPARSQVPRVYRPSCVRADAGVEGRKHAKERMVPGRVDATKDFRKVIACV